MELFGGDIMVVQILTLICPQALHLLLQAGYVLVIFPASARVAIAVKTCLSVCCHVDVLC